MAGSYTLELELFSLLNGSVDGFEIIADGTLLGGYSSVVSSNGSTISIIVPFGGALPTSLEFRFNDTNASTVDQIEVRSVAINDRYVNTGNYLSGNILNDGDTANVDVTNNAFLFDVSEPASTEFTTGATQTFTSGNDSYRGFDDITPQVFDMLGGRDTAYLGAGADKVNGGDGADTLHGFGGDDLLFGDAGNDRIYGGDGADTLYGGDGNDRIHGNDGNDEIHGGAGDDRLNGHTGDDIITGGAGADRINGGSGSNILFGGEGDDQIIGGANQDTIDGGADNDLLYGLGGNDQINGGDGNDTLVGGAGDDILHGDAGNDIVYGQAGNDTLFGGTGNDFVFGGNGNDTLSGGDGEDEVFGGDGVDDIDGGDGHDIIRGGDDGDTINTGAGDDIVFADGGGSAQGWTYKYYDLGSSPNTLANAGFTENSGIDNSLDATSQGITTDFDPNVFDTGDNYALKYETFLTITTAGNYTFRTTSDDGSALFLDGVQIVDNDGLHGAVTVTSASQTLAAGVYKLDATFFERNGGNVLEIEISGPDTGNIFVDLASYASVNPANGLGSTVTGDDVINTGDGNDTIYGDGGNDTIDGGSGDDLIFGGAGDDTLIGGSGAGFDTVYGGDGNDTILGFGNQDNLFGNAGDDTIDGGNGTDNIYGGTGVDTLNGDQGDDNFFLANGDFSAGESIDGGIETDQIILTNATTVDFTTGTLVRLETLTGSSGDDDVTYTIQQALDFDDIDLGSGTDNSRINIAGIVDVTALGTPIVVSAENGFLTGSSGNDDLTISGGQLDSLIFGAGTIDFDTGTDVINLTSTSADLNMLGATDASIVNLEEINATNSTAGVNFNLFNQSENFTIVGGIYDDRIDSGTGDDTIDAGLGNDEIFGGNGDDAINGGAGDDLIVGENGDDYIDGGAGNDIINGGSRNDTILGGIGNDTIRGSSGVDDVFGGDGNDTFLLDNGDFGVGEIIDGGEQTDEIILTNATTVDFTTGTLVNLETLTGSVGNDDVTIDGITLNQFIAINFETGTDVLRLTSTSTGLNTLANGNLTNLQEINASTATAAVAINVSTQTEDLIVVGSANNDTLTTGSGADTITGGAGDDTIDGGNGLDDIEGGLGNDIINGGQGADTLYAFDNTVNTLGNSLNFVNEIIFQENFGANTGAFTFSDGGFGGTDGANVDVNGTRITTDGNNANGALRVLVDGQNNTAFTNGSGSWDSSFTAGSDLVGVQITFSYRHIHAAENDIGEDSRVFFEFDGQILNQAGANNFISEAYGAAETTDTGWVTVTIDLPDLTSGTTYDLSLGILHLGATLADEDAEVRFDDILLTAGAEYGSIDTTTADADSGSNNTVNGGDNNDTIFGSAGINFLNGDAGDDMIFSGTVADEIIFADSFDANAGSYTYVEDFFTASSTSGYALGNYVGTDGSDAAGSLSITLGGQDNADITDINGAWSTTFTLLEAKNDLILSFDFRLFDSQTISDDPFDPGEDIQLFADIDGTTYSNDANPYFFELLGVNSFNANDTGWQTISLNVGSLGAGAHTLSLGAVLSLKTFQPEEYTLRFDDVSLVDTALLNVNTLAGGDGLDTLYGSSGRDVFLFEATTAFNDLDVIENFGYTLDAVDLSDLLTGFNDATDDINNFVQLTESAGNTTIAVDTTGAGSFAGNEVTVINGVTGLDIDVMQVDGTLIF